jgi:Transposase DNA-binding
MTSTHTDRNNTVKWAEKHFSGIVSTDKRRKQRVINFAALMKDSPGKSIPQLWGNPYDVKATYNLFKHPESTPDFLQRGHRELVKNKIKEEGTYIII